MEIGNGANKMTTLNELKEQNEAPSWMNEESYFTLSKGYLLPNETPKQMYKRVSSAAAKYYKGSSENWAKKFFDAIWNNWLCLASPVASNMGTDRGLPISCLTGDTWINTMSGGKQIRDLNVGDMVLTHMGRFRKVIAKKSRVSTDDLYEIKVGTRLTKTKITGNHPVLTNLGWVRVDELDPRKHFIATNHLFCVPEEEYTIDMSNYINYPTKEINGKLYKAIENNGPKHKQKANGIVEHYTAPNRFVKVDNDVAWALGLWCAEGSKSTGPNKDPNGARITMGTHEQLFIDKWVEIIGNKFGFNGSSYKSEVCRDGFTKSGKSSWLNGNCNGISFGNFFVNEFGENCKTKTLPEWVIKLPKEQLKHFMAAFVQGDGHVMDNGNWSITLANPNLLLGLYNICLKLEISVSLQMQAKPSKLGKTKYVYVLRSLKDDSIKLSKFNADNGIVVGDLRYCSIINLNKLNFNEEVFDISVEEDNSFSASGFIVHNCNSLHVGDSIDSIFDKNHELAVLSKNGAGVGIYMGDIRGRGAPIKGNGTSEGIVPWAKVYDTTTMSVNQGATRRGASALYLPVGHLDTEEFINIRRPVGDTNRRCLNLHHGICIDDEFMNRVEQKEEKAKIIWTEILKARYETGEPYMFFTDNVNRQNPETYNKLGLKVKTSNICVTGDQRVVTDKGIKTVYELYNSKENLNLFDGNKKITASPMQLIEKNANVFRITTNEGRTHDITADHKIMTKGGMTACKDLKPGDQIVIQRKEGLFGIEHRPEMAFLLGLYHGDGTQTEDKTFVDIWENDFKLKDEIEKCFDVIYQKYDLNTYQINMHHGGVCKRTINSPKFVNQKVIQSDVKKIRIGSSKFKQFGFEKNKIPEWLWCGDKETQSQYLRGLYISDGCARLETGGKSYGEPLYLSLGNTSLSLLKDVQIMLSNMGINSKIYDLADKRVVSLPNGKGGYSEYNCKKAWRLNINDKNSALIFEKQTGYLTYKNVKLEKRKYRDNTKKFDTIRSIEQINNQDVYCTTVDSKEHVWVCNSFITSNCNEIFLHTDPDHTFVCCLSSLNLLRWDEWKNTDLVRTAIYFLDAVMEEYILKAQNVRGFESAVRFAKKSRALGLGVLGWHSLLQSKQIPFDSFDAMTLNAKIFRHMREKADETTLELGKIYGEPEWCAGSGRRNSHTMAVAPTVSNALISGGVSQGIEPLISNVYAQKSAKGTFIRKNPELKKMLEARGKDTIEIWNQINNNQGSVIELDFLTAEEKEVFLTAKEINQFAIINQAAQRQRWIDQGQSVNLFFGTNSDPKYIHEVHMEAWRKGMKGLYYCRTESVLKTDNVFRSKDECQACEA